MNSNDDDLLRVIHSTMNFSLIARQSTHRLFVPNLGYLVSAINVDTLCNNFDNLKREPFWNPYARFLIIIESLRDIELRQVFDALLRQHVNNALVVNGTKAAHLYTYNPFDNYACGRYYDAVISYGLCSEATHNLYPNKFVTDLRNCTFRASLTSRPPYTINSTQNEYRNKITGLEQYVLKTVSESDEFNINFDFNFQGLPYTVIAPNMTAIGPMDILQINKTDILCGAMILTVSRFEAFTAIYGYSDYVDDLIFTVKKASYVPNWKYFYLEFDVTVWVLLLVSSVVYSVILVYILRPRDKGEVLLTLLGNLIMQGRNISAPSKVRYILIMWIWFTYLVSTFYQCSLVSLMTNPIREYQISTENDITEYNLRPCITIDLAKLLYAETDKIQYSENNIVKNNACNSVPKSLDLISKNGDMYTITATSYHKYNFYIDKYGDPLLHYIEKPYAKVLYSLYFYKGFPVSCRFKLNVMRMRESGLSDKNLRDQYYMRSLKNRVSAKKFKYRFVAPWGLYTAGCLVATTSFFIEFICKLYKRCRLD